MNLKQKIRKGELTLGSWVTIPHPSIVEIMATAGFDWLTIDIEHSAIDLEKVQLLISTIQGHQMKAFVRVYDNDEVIIKRVLDAGADGVIVPMIKSKAEAIKLVESVYYPPKGRRGVGLSRAQNFGIGFEAYQERLEKEICIIAQIEHINAINEIEDILSVDEIDCTLIGPYDLSASMGKPGQYHLPEVKAAIEKYDQMCKKLKKPMGAHVISSSASETKAKMDVGYSFLAFSLDFFFLGDKAREEMNKLRS
ncbi:MAG: aldolase/citrate lyase family protein [Crocinitomicaceae bacterium]